MSSSKFVKLALFPCSVHYLTFQDGYFILIPQISTTFSPNLGHISWPCFLGHWKNRSNQNFYKILHVESTTKTQTHTLCILFVFVTMAHVPKVNLPFGTLATVLFFFLLYWRIEFLLAIRLLLAAYKNDAISPTPTTTTTKYVPWPYCSLCLSTLQIHPR